MLRIDRSTAKPVVSPLDRTVTILTNNTRMLVWPGLIGLISATLVALLAPGLNFAERSTMAAVAGLCAAGVGIASGALGAATASLFGVASVCILLQISLGRDSVVLAATHLVLAVVGFVACSWLAGRLAPRLTPSHRTLRAGAVLGVSGLILRTAGPLLVGGNLANGQVSLPGPLPSIQIGEFSRIVFLVSLSLIVWCGGDTAQRHAGWFVAGLIGNGLYLAISLAVDSGPAVLTVGAATLALVHMRRSRPYSGRRSISEVSTMHNKHPARIGMICGCLIIGAIAALRTNALASVIERVGVRVADWQGAGGSMSAQAALARTAISGGGALGHGYGSSQLASHVVAGSSDYAPALLAAELGVFVAAVLIIVVIVALGTILAATYKVETPAGSAGVGLLSMQLLWVGMSVAGAWLVLPLTGISAPFIAVTGSSLLSSACACGLAVGLVKVASGNRVSLINKAGIGLSPAVVGTCACVAVAAMVIVSMPVNRSAFAIYLARGDILDRSGGVIATTLDNGGRSYPSGALYSDLGVFVPDWAAWGIESDSRLTCSDSLTWKERISQIFAPAPCRPATLVTTVSPQLQRRAMTALSGLNGSAVVTNGLTGEILSLYSSNSVDPGTLLRRNAPQAPPAPVRREATAPGSVIKPLVAAAAVDFGIDTSRAPETVLETDGQAIHNSGGGTCPGTSLVAALAASCNTVMGYAAIQVGVGRLSSYLSKVFGADTERDFDVGEVAGLRTGLKEVHSTAALARTGFGQESMATSPLDLAGAYGNLLASAVGNDQPALIPHAISGTCVGDGWSEIKDVETVGTLPGPGAAVALEGMEAAVASPWGTARALRYRSGIENSRFPDAAKTGTAEVPNAISITGVVRWAVVIVDRTFVIVVQVRDRSAGEINPALAVAKTLASEISRHDPRNEVVGKDPCANALSGGR